MKKAILCRKRYDKAVSCDVCSVGHAPILLSIPYVAEMKGKTLDVELKARLCTVCDAMHTASRAFQHELELKLALAMALRTKWA